jgi:hypothetical protein
VADRKLAKKIESSLDGIEREEIENRIRLIAYGIWEEEGRPHGRHAHHWREAERRAAQPKSRAPRTRKAKVGAAG